MDHQSTDCPSVLSSGESAPLVLRSVSGPSLQERHGGPGACPKKGNEAGEWSGAQALGGVAEGAGIVQSGEEKTQGRSHCTLQLPEGRL